eukprot:scaffold63219_cov33-Tisochrysis_lutea.AAC.6
MRARSPIGHTPRRTRPPPTLARSHEAAARAPPPLSARGSIVRFAQSILATACAYTVGAPC